MSDTPQPGSRPFGRTGVVLPLLGQGTWEMQDDAAPEAALARGLDLGLTHVDTAEMYGEGRCEEIVARALGTRRAQVFLASKVLPHNASRTGTIRACERSLRRLGTDHLDLYLLHWRGAHPLAETVAAFEQLCEEGKIRFYGVSNFDVPDLEEVLAIAGEGRIACNQILYHPGERMVENAVIPFCAARGIAVVAYSPLGQGALPAPGSAAGRALAAVAERRGVSVAQVALRFVVRRAPVFAIPKASRLAHVEDNAAALGWELDAEEIEALEAACPRSARRRGIPML